MTAEPMIASRSAGGFGLLTPTALALKRVVRGRALDVSLSGTLLQALRPFDIGSSVRILRGNDLLQEPRTCDTAHGWILPNVIQKACPGSRRRRESTDGPRGAARFLRHYAAHGD